MVAVVKPIAALLLSAAIVLAGNALEGVLLPLRGDLEGFTRLEIGLIGSAYYTGLMIGCLVCPWAIARVGHIRAFAVFTAVATASPLIEAIWVVPEVWWLIRGLTGVCFAGILMVFESWLNGVATNDTRGRVLAIYTIVNLSAVMLGQQLINLGEPGGFELFSLAAIMFSVAAAPVALTLAPTPSLPRAPSVRLLWLARLSPAAVVGSAGAGLANGALYSLGPVYAKSSGLPVSLIAVFMTFAILGGALAQLPIGRVSDRVDRRKVLAVITSAACLLGLALYAVSGGRAEYKLALIFAFGLCALPVYWISLAHANDYAEREDSVDVSSNLLLVFSAAAVCGPIFASMLMDSAGPGGLFLWTAAIHAVVAALVIYRTLMRDPLPPGERDAYVSLPQKSSPALYELDPRTTDSAKPAAAPKRTSAAAESAAPPQKP
ncbi:MAG: MFS transporter [Hyphomicrobiales bacterium]|nr:MFS transporter [Hyphomicrobiales bacterium]